MSNPIEKQCAGPCGLIKSLSDFHIHKNGLYGHRSRCKICKSQESAEYRKNNPNQAIQYRKNNATKAKVYGAKYRKDNANILKDYFTQHRLNNQDTIIKWRKDNPDYAKLYRQDHKDTILAKAAIYRQNNKQAIAEHATIYRKNNKQKLAEYGVKYRQDNPGKVNEITAKRRAAKLQRTVAWADLKAIKQVYADCEEINLAAKTAGCTDIFTVDHVIPLQGEFVSGLHVEYNLDIITLSANSSKGNRFTPG